MSTVHAARARIVRSLPPALIAALVLLACQATPTPSAASAAPTTTAVTATQSPIPSPTPAATGIPASEVTGSTGALAPGRYTRGGFEPRITFELDGPWHSVNAFHDFFDVQQDVGSPDVIAVQFALPRLVYPRPDQPAEVPNAAAAVVALEGNTRLKTVESSTSKIGGLDGYHITVENPADDFGDVTVLVVGPGALGISPGRRLWCAFFDTPQGILAILVGGSVARWDEALEASEPVLESVTIGE
jgi:hypothetical protein